MDDPRALHITDAAKLETVIPAIDHPVKLCGGDHMGRVGNLIAIDQGNYSTTVDLLDGTRVEQVPYEWVCKLALG